MQIAAFGIAPTVAPTDPVGTRHKDGVGGYSDETRPATRAEIERLTGERDRWLPRAEEVALVVIIALALGIVQFWQ